MNGWRARSGAGTASIIVQPISIEYLTGMARDRDGYLFTKYDFFGVQEGYKRKLQETIEAADTARVQDASVDDIAERFAAEFRLEAPELTEGAMSVDIAEAKVDVTGDFRYGHFGHGPHYVNGVRVTYFVPFVGDPDMFHVAPTTYTTVHPYAEIVGQELRFTFERPGKAVDETKRAFEEELGRVKQYLGWLRENLSNFNQTLLPLARQHVDARRSRLADLQKSTNSLGIPIRRSTPSPATATTAVRRTTSARGAEATSIPPSPAKFYDVALSFAGENRGYVEEVATGLKTAGIAVFYDAFEQATLWGKNLVDHLAEIYQKRSRFVVMFVSEYYAKKAWPQHERQHAQARALLAKEEYILPARFDDTEVPGMTATVGYVDLRKMTPTELVALIVSKVGKARK